MEAEEWLRTRGSDFTEPEREFTEASVALRVKEEDIKRGEEALRVQEHLARDRMRHQIARGATAAASIFLILATLFGWQWWRANDQRQRAEDATQITQGQQATILSQQPGREVEAVVLAVQSAGPAILNKRQLSPEMFEGLAASTEAFHELVVLGGHTSAVYSACFSPDGTRVVTASFDRTARLWDGKNGKLFAMLKGHTDWVNSAYFSPDGTRVVTASGDSSARLWDGKTGKPLAVLKGHMASVRFAYFSPDGTRVVTASDDNTVIIYPTTDVYYFRLAVNLLRYHPEFEKVREYGIGYLNPDGSVHASP